MKQQLYGPLCLISKTIQEHEQDKWGSVTKTTDEFLINIF